MRNGILKTDVENRGFVLDPRTKLLLLITMSVFVLGSAGSGEIAFLSPCLCFCPMLLLISCKKYSSAGLYAVVYSAAWLANMYLLPLTTGFFHFIILGTSGILGKFMPSVMMGLYVVSTTTVSEFTAAMQRMHVSEKLIIPLSVMFRLFPTVADEFSAINSAMRMRGISFGGRQWPKMLEYRLIPLMTCSVQIGNELSAAALTRGLGGNTKRTNVCKIGFHMQDGIAVLFCVGCFVCLALLLCGVFG